MVVRGEHNLGMKFVDHDSNDGCGLAAVVRGKAHPQDSRLHSLGPPVACGWAGAVAKKERLSRLARHRDPHGHVP